MHGKDPGGIITGINRALIFETKIAGHPDEPEAAINHALTLVQQGNRFRRRRIYGADDRNGRLGACGYALTCVFHRDRATVDETKITIRRTLDDRTPAIRRQVYLAAVDEFRSI
ncbi:MAG: hypothetical protein AB7E60_10900, partial [Sphingobium sp.]